MEAAIQDHRVTQVEGIQEIHPRELPIKEVQAAAVQVIAEHHPAPLPEAAALTPAVLAEAALQGLIPPLQEAVPQAEADLPIPEVAVEVIVAAAEADQVADTNHKK
jgi:hypothetical protein